MGVNVIITFNLHVINSIMWYNWRVLSLFKVSKKMIKLRIRRDLQTFISKFFPILWLDLDDLAPATDYVVTKRDQAVKLRMSQKGPGSEKPLTVPSMFYQTVQRVPNHPAIGKNIW